MEAITVTKENFESAVINSELPVVVDFMATWCGFCKKLSPVIDRLAEKYEGKVIFAKLDTADADELNTRYNIDTLPTLYLFKNGTHGQNLIAPGSQAEVEDWIKSQTEI